MHQAQQVETRLKEGCLNTGDFVETEGWVFHSGLSLAEHSFKKTNSRISIRRALSWLGEPFIIWVDSLTVE